MSHAQQVPAIKQEDDSDDYVGTYDSFGYQMTSFSKENKSTWIPKPSGNTSFSSWLFFRVACPKAGKTKVFRVLMGQFEQYSNYFGGLPEQQRQAINNSHIIDVVNIPEDHVGKALDIQMNPLPELVATLLEDETCCDLMETVKTFDLKIAHKKITDTLLDILAKEFNGDNAEYNVKRFVKIAVAAHRHEFSASMDTKTNRIYLDASIKKWCLKLFKNIMVGRVPPIMPTIFTIDQIRSLYPYFLQVEKQNAQTNQPSRQYLLCPAFPFQLTQAHLDQPLFGLLYQHSWTQALMTYWQRAHIPLFIVLIESDEVLEKTVLYLDVHSSPVHPVYASKFLKNLGHHVVVALHSDFRWKMYYVDDYPNHFQLQPTLSEPFALPGATPFQPLMLETELDLTNPPASQANSPATQTNAAAPDPASAAASQHPSAQASETTAAPAATPAVPGPSPDTADPQPGPAPTDKDAPLHNAPRLVCVYPTRTPNYPKPPRDNWRRCGADGNYLPTTLHFAFLTTRPRFKDDPSHPSKKATVIPLPAWHDLHFNHTDSGIDPLTCQPFPSTQHGKRSKKRAHPGPLAAAPADPADNTVVVPHEPGHFGKTARMLQSLTAHHQSYHNPFDT